MKSSRTLAVALGILVPVIQSARAAEAPGAAPRPKTVLLIAGKKSHGPGEHEYEKAALLLKHCLDTSPNLKGLRSEVHLNGWPEDPGALERADTIFLFSDGSDRDEAAHPLLHGNRLQLIEKQMARGCGLVVLHYTVFVPSKRGGEEFLAWVGGYFDYQNGPGAAAAKDGPDRWFSKISTATTEVTPLAPRHPVSRGLKPFRLREEYYYNMRFREKDPRRTDILATAIPGAPRPEVVAWAVERPGGGRGFAFTGGHFHDNWKVPEFRRLMLNALVFTAGLEVPEGGVDSTLPEPAESKKQP